MSDQNHNEPERIQQENHKQGDVEEEIPETKLNPQRQQEIYNEFKIAVRNQNFEKVNEILNQYQKDLELVNKIDPQTRQISTYIAAVIPEEEIALKMIKLLIDFGANITFKDQMKQSIIFYIARDGKAKLMEFLIQYGLNVNESDLYGQTPLFYAARENRIQFVTKLLEFHADVNHVDGLSSQTALFYAAREGHEQMCQLLMDHGCNPSHQDAQRKSAVFYAKKQQQKEVVELFNRYQGKAKEEQNKTKETEDTQQKKKKKEKEVNKQTFIQDNKVPKQSYKLVFTDNEGNQKDVTAEDFEKFKLEYPDVAQLLLNADDLIDDQMVNQVKDDETWEKLAKKILTQLWKSKGAYFFYTPVDPKKYGIDDYFEIVKKPMDFGTVKTKLHQNVYKAPQDFVDDMNQVFQNCLLYNGTETDVGKIGVSIGIEFKEVLQAQNFGRYLDK